MSETTGRHQEVVLKDPHLVRIRSGSRKGALVCPVGESLHLVGNEKKLIVVHFLLERPMRFNELTKLGIDSKTLSRVLKKMEKDGLVNRNVSSTPFLVQYSLTEMGKELKQAIDSLWSWANRWII